MLRAVTGVIGGFVAWLVVATVVNIVFRLTWPEYAQVERAMKFTLGMLLARLALGAVSSLCAGYVVAWITNSNRVATFMLIGVLLVIFVPQHYMLWQRLPVWYHLVFLVSLIVIPLLGAKLHASRRRDREATENATSHP